MPISSSETIYSEARRVVINAVTGLKLGERKATDADLRVLGINYGRQLIEFAGASAQTLKEGGEAYTGLTCTPDTFVLKVQNVEDLGLLRDALAGALKRVNDAYNDARVDLGDDVTQVFTATEAAKIYPGLKPEQRAQAIEASSSLYKLSADRKAEKAAALASTLTKKQALQSEKAETSATIESLQDEIEAKTLENKFLKRGALQPEDFTGAPVTPPDTAAAFKAPSPAAAPRRAGRRGRR